MEIWERWRGQTNQAEVSPVVATPPEKEAVPPPHPDAIDAGNHPLRFYPGFTEFAKEWNAYILSDYRMSQFRMVEDAREGMEGVTARYERELAPHEENILVTF